MGVSPLSKDQYKLYADIMQPLTDLAVVSQQKKIIQANNDLNKIDLDVKLYQIKQRISDLYFGILLVQGQLVQTRLSKDNLESGLKNIQAAVTYGVSLQRNEDVLMAELLSLDQRIIEQKAILNAYRQMLELFIGITINESTVLEKPQILELTPTINRPELNFFNTSLQTQQLQSELLHKNNLPKFSLFLQSGFGRPALNFLSNDFEPYYVGGLRLSWNLSRFYTAKGSEQIYTVNQEMINVERETFLFNTKLTMNSQLTESKKMQELILQDEKIIALRERIIEASKGQLANGVITSNDYKSAVMEADKARQNRVLHEIELIKIKNNYKLTSGN
jgi:outer membrane protein TolC